LFLLALLNLFCPDRNARCNGHDSIELIWLGLPENAQAPGSIHFYTPPLDGMGWHQSVIIVAKPTWFS
jgi:hypothetical protein